MAIHTSRLQGFGVGLTLVAGASVTVESKNRSEERAQFVVSNLAASGSGNNLYILSTDGNEAMPVFPQSSVTLETDSTFKVYNASAATISYQVGQLYLRGVIAPVGGSGGGRAGGGGGAGSGGSRLDGSVLVPGRHIP
jgi:hypothetical protein